MSLDYREPVSPPYGAPDCVEAGELADIPLALVSPQRQLVDLIGDPPSSSRDRQRGRRVRRR